MNKVILTSIATVLVATSSIFGATYQIDASHADVGFKVSHLGISKTKGQFSDVSGQVTWEGLDKLKAASFKGVIQVNSISTLNEKRDNHLRSADFFDVSKFETITFESTKVFLKEKALVVKGDLTLHGVTKSVEFPVNVSGPVKNPWGQTVVGFEGDLEIDRRDYGLTWNKTLDKGGLVVGNIVTIHLNVEASK